MAITGIDTIEGKQIIAAGATSAKYAGAAKSGNTEFSLAQVANTVTTHSAQWDQGAQAISYTATADSAFKTNSAIETNALLSPPGSVVAQYVTAGLTPSGVIVTQYQGGIATGYYTASTDGENITLSSKWGSNTPRSRVISTTHDYVYSGSDLVVDTVDAAITVKDNSAAWGGGSIYTGNVQEALDEVYTNSSDWNESYDTLTANSASWGTTYTGDAQGALDEVYTNSSKWNGEYYSASNPSAFVTNDELTAALTSKEDTLTFGYTDSKISQINGSAIYSQGGASYTGNVQEALDEVYTNSSNWNESYETLTANSASWGGDELPLSAGEGISLSVVDNKLVISDSGLANKEDKLTFAYTDSKISQINGSAIYSQGGGGGVSGTNVVFVPQYEGANYGVYYSATISGDVGVTTGSYYEDEIYPGTTVFSLSSVGASIGNKLDKNKIEDSNTIKIINNHAEVTNKAYRPTGFTNMSADYVNVGGYNVNAYFMPADSNLYSAIVTVETTASGSYIPDGWSLVSYENNSAIFTKYYLLNQNSDNFSLYNADGWGDFTNAEASATVYSALELATLAFKDDITTGGGGVPQSAFDELKSSYDALSSLFSTYSGQWLLPNTGV